MISCFRECPKCRRCYDGCVETCPDDATPLSAPIRGSLLVDAKYHIERSLGRGGMGAVYLAVRIDDVYSKRVALKLLRSEVETEEIVERFRQEREILASLDHPNISRLLDGGTTAEGAPYFVMDYVDGQPIDVYCDDHRLTVGERLKLFESVCGAVEYSHSRGVAHRDLKPGNILVSQSGQVKLLDFGIARLMRAEPGGRTAYLTRTGRGMLTPEYASPEQVKGEQAGVASDTYSLGVVLFEILTGHRPYRLRSRLLHEVVRVICEEDPTRPSSVVTETDERPREGESLTTVTPQVVSRARETTPAELRRSLTGDLDNILLKALQKDPAHRYASVRDLGADLKRHLEGLPVEARGPGVWYQANKFLKRYQWWVAGGVVLAAGVASGAIQINPAAAAAAVIFLTIVALRYQLMKAESGRTKLSQRLFTWLLYLVGFLVLSALTVNLPYGLHLIQLLLVAIGIYYSFLLARWLGRERRRGPLLVDASCSQGGIATAVLWVGVVATICLIVVGIADWPHQRWVFSPAFGLGMVGMHRLWTRRIVEVRTSGITFHGRAILWKMVQSYSWQSVDPRIAVLRIQLAHAPRWWPLVSVPVNPSAKSAVAAILDEHFSPWQDPNVTL